MFIFEGALSERCKKYMVTRNKIGGIVISCIAFGAFSIPIVLLAFTMDWFYIYFIFALLIFPVLSITPLAKPNEKLLFPAKIEIATQDDTPYIAAESDQYEAIHELSHVKNVIDMKDWYVFVFCFPYKDERFVCEKALLRQGTIEEFEEYFSEQIVRKG